MTIPASCADVFRLFLLDLKIDLLPLSIEEHWLSPEMCRTPIFLVPFLVALATALPGCAAVQNKLSPKAPDRQANRHEVAVRFQELTARSTEVARTLELVRSNPKILLASATATEDEVQPPTGHQLPDESELRQLSLEETVRIALENSSILRNNGSRVLEQPERTQTSLDPAVIFSDAAFGVEAARSAFDPRLEGSLTWNHGQIFNSSSATGPFGLFLQPEVVGQLGVRKTFESGTEAAVGGLTGFDPDFDPEAFGGVGASFRHPLKRGHGKTINRIAGPYAIPGMYRGIWIAEINQESSRLSLEQSVRDLVRQVVVLYWELQFAWQRLDAAIDSRERAREAWKLELDRVRAKIHTNDQEAIARQQFHEANAAVTNALCGAPETPSGVYAVELQLRTLLGLPAYDGKLIQPSTSVLSQDANVNWDESVAHAREHRVEIRRQMQNIRRQALQVTAAEHMRQSRFDVVGQYRDTLDQAASSSTSVNGGRSWSLGVEFQKPLGNRRAEHGVHAEELQLMRERMILEEQMRQIMAQLRSAITEIERASSVSQSLAASRVAALDKLRAEMKRNAANEAEIEDVLRAQRRAADAQIAFARSMIDYNIAVANLHFARGSLLETVQVHFLGDEENSNDVRSSMALPSSAMKVISAAATDWAKDD